jgi:hypothetical protein
MQKTTQESSTLGAAIKRLAITKDAKRVLLALAEADDWTPMSAMTTLLGKAGVRRVADAVTYLIREHLAEGGRRDETPDEMFLRARRIEEWS